MKPYRNHKTWQARGAGGKFRRWTLADHDLGCPICPKCGALNPYQLHSYTEENGFIEPTRNAPPTNCHNCGAELASKTRVDPQ